MEENNSANNSAKIKSEDHGLVFLEEPAIELLARLDGKEKMIYVGKRISELNDMLVDGEIVLLRIYKIDYRKTIHELRPIEKGELWNE